MNSIESLKYDEKKHLAVCMVAWKIAENIHRIVQGKGDISELQIPFEERWKRVLEQYKNDSLFVWLQEYVFHTTKWKYLFLQGVQWMVHEAMLSQQQGKKRRRFVYVFLAKIIPFPYIQTHIFS